MSKVFEHYRQYFAKFNIGIICLKKGFALSIPDELNLYLAPV